MPPAAVPCCFCSSAQRFERCRQRAWVCWALSKCTCLLFWPIAPSNLRPLAGECLGGFSLRVCRERWFGADTLDVEPLARHAVGKPGFVLAGAFLWNSGVTAAMVGITMGDQPVWPVTNCRPTPAACFNWPGIYSVQRDYHLFLPPPSAVVSHLLVPDRRTGGFPVDRGYGALVAGGNARARRGTNSCGTLDGNQPAANLARLHGAGGYPVFHSQITGRELYSRQWAAFGFWMLLILGGWVNLNSGSPLPVWSIKLSQYASALFIFVLIAIGWNLRQTARRAVARIK